MNEALAFSTVIVQFRSVCFYLASVVLKGGGNGGEVSTFVSHDLHLPVPCSIICIATRIIIYIIFMAHASASLSTQVT